MRSLFLRIFVWFWLAMVALAVSLLLVAITTGTEPVSRMANRGVALYAKMAVQIYERDGDARLQEYLSDLEQSSYTRAGLFDEHGQPIAVRSLPPEAQPVVMDALQEHSYQFKLTPEAAVVAHRVHSKSGKLYVFAVALPDTAGLRQRITEAISIRLAVVFLTATVL